MNYPPPGVTIDGKFRFAPVNFIYETTKNQKIYPILCGEKMQGAGCCFGARLFDGCPGGLENENSEPKETGGRANLSQQAKRDF